MIRNNSLSRVVALALVVSFACAGVASAQTASAGRVSKVDPAEVDALAGSLGTALAGLGANATQADAEASLTYVLDQSRQSAEVAYAALLKLRSSKTWSQPIRKAIDAVVARRGATGGTGAISPLTTGLGSGPSFGAGGGTDYSGN